MRLSPIGTRLRVTAIAFGLLMVSITARVAHAADRPNVLWLISDDHAAYVTACYGSLTSFNVLFADDDDRFKGSAGGG